MTLTEAIRELNAITTVKTIKESIAPFPPSTYFKAHSPLMITKEFFYDSISNLDDEELDSADNLGFIQEEDIIIPEGTKLYYETGFNLGGAGVYQFKVNDTPYTLAFSNDPYMLKDFLDHTNFESIDESVGKSKKMSYQEYLSRTGQKDSPTAWK